MFNVDNLTPVVVRPTASHIETATERIPFDENMVHTSCPITQSPFQSSDRINNTIDYDSEGKKVMNNGV